MGENKPESWKANKNVDDLSDCYAEIHNYIEIEKAYKKPVQTSDNKQNKRYYV